MTVMVLKMGLRLAPRDQRSGVDGCRAARDPSPSDPPPVFQKDLKEEARVWEVADVYTPLENQESMLKETET